MRTPVRRRRRSRTSVPWPSSSTGGTTGVPAEQATMGARFDGMMDLFRALNRQQVDYKVVGMLAVNLLGSVQGGGEELELCLQPSVTNLERFRSALREVWSDSAIEEIVAEDLAHEYPLVIYGPPGGGFLVYVLGRVEHRPIVHPSKTPRLTGRYYFEDIESEPVVLGGVSIPVPTPKMLYGMLITRERRTAAGGLRMARPVRGLDSAHDSVYLARELMKDKPEQLREHDQRWDVELDPERLLQRLREHPEIGMSGELARGVFRFRNTEEAREGLHAYYMEHSESYRDWRRSVEDWKRESDGMSLSEFLDLKDGG